MQNEAKDQEAFKEIFGSGTTSTKIAWINRFMRPTLRVAQLLADFFQWSS